MSMDICIPAETDWGCVFSAEEIQGLDPRVKERSEALAWSTLAALTGYRLSLCPISIRPCAARCTEGTWFAAPTTDYSFAGAPAGGVFTPYISNGTWYNACGCSSPSDCSCSSICEVVLPGAVGSIVDVELDGAVLDKSAYRVDNGNRLVRTDGECWPACQDMTAPRAITYEPVVMDMDGTATITFTREGNLVHVFVQPLVVGGSTTLHFAPWRALGGQTEYWQDGFWSAVTIGGGDTVSTNIGNVTVGPWEFGYETEPDTTAPDATGSFVVTYYPGLAPNEMFSYAAGILAVEFYRACSGGKCRLPAGVTSVARQGVTFEVASGLFTSGWTGIREVDAVIRIYNPNGLVQPSRVLSPDQRRGRIPTWSA